MIQNYKYQGEIDIRNYKDNRVAFLNDSTTPLINEIDWNLQEKNVVLKYIITETELDNIDDNKFNTLEGKLIFRLYIDENTPYDEFRSFNNEIDIKINAVDIHEILLRNNGKHLTMLIEYDKEKEENKQREISKVKNLETAKRLYDEFEKFCRSVDLKPNEIVTEIKKSRKI